MFAWFAHPAWQFIGGSYFCSFTLHVCLLYRAKLATAQTTISRPKRKQGCDMRKKMPMAEYKRAFRRMLQAREVASARIKLGGSVRGCLNE